MKQGLFYTQINKAEKLLKTIDLLTERTKFPLYKKFTRSNFDGLTYADIWKKCYLEKIFDFLLTDYSVIQLRCINFKPLEVSYSFIECPYIPIFPLEEFIDQQMITDEESSEYDVIRDYELFLPELKESVTPIRYDYAPLLYNEGHHPASHIHFGYKNEIRVGTKNILKPLSFVLFIIRQHYPEKWRKFTLQNDAEQLCRNISQNLDLVDDEYWGLIDKWEMILS